MAKQKKKSFSPVKVILSAPKKLLVSGALGVAFSGCITVNLVGEPDPCADPVSAISCNPPFTEFDCSNFADDDGDGLVDCSDPDCFNGGGASFCNPPFGEFNCTDGADDDFDGAIDCQDIDCAGGPACQSAEQCFNGLDDDGDGLVDCVDSDCFNNGICNPPSICGNGRPNDGFSTEECDDGNLVDGDGCSAFCLIEAGYECSLLFGVASVCEPIACGNGLGSGGAFQTNPLEPCDDGNNIDGDGCSADCNPEPGFVCAGAPSQCQLICGDGTISFFELCDDSNLNNGDGCDDNCKIEPGFECPVGFGVAGACTPIVCGNGLTFAGGNPTPEQCDDGAANSDTEPDACRTDCTIYRCGDGVQDSFEQCDDGNTISGDSCTAFCSAARCGNGIIEPGEQCDDGNSIDTDSCDNTCQ